MHFRHRQMDSDIVAQARDVYITSRAKNDGKKLKTKTSQKYSVRRPLCLFSAEEFRREYTVGMIWGKISFKPGVNERGSYK